MHLYGYYFKYVSSLPRDLLYFNLQFHLHKLQAMLHVW